MREFLIMELEAFDKIARNVYFEKTGRRSIKKRVIGFRDKKHFFEHIEKFLEDEAKRLLELE